MSDVSDSPKKSPTKAAIASAGVAFMKLREGMCKFPLGGFNEPVDRFCGATTEIGTPYCGDCRKRVYTRPERRR